MPRKIVIIGAGTYGSYIANCISEKYPDDKIHLFDVGNDTTQSEQQIGFFSKVKKGGYKAATDGRFFGLGGTSSKWGGQLFFFSDFDFVNDSSMHEIVDCNKLYRDKVLSRFFDKTPMLKEHTFGGGLFVKQGIWLKYRQRNLFKHFKLREKDNITIYKNARVAMLNSENGKITSITVRIKGQEDIVQFEADTFYLTAGAFESLRLMHVSNLLNIEKSSFGFSDHVSLQCFEIKNNKTKVGLIDFQFRFSKGSMITSRLVGETDNVSFYIHPIFNGQFYFFQLLKQLLFKKEFSFKTFVLACKQFIFVFPFIYNFLFKKKLYVYGNWYLNIDIELAQSCNIVRMSDELDKNGQHGIEMEYTISENTMGKLKHVKQKLEQILFADNIDYADVSNIGVSSLKLEDIYHPYHLFNHNDKEGISKIYNPVGNLYLFNTGLLQRAGGINPSATIFCLIEQHIDEIKMY